MIKAVLGLAVALLAGSPAHADTTNLLHAERSLYREVLVYETGGVRCMCFTRECRLGRQSCYDTRQPNRIVMNYPRMMLASLYVEPQPQSVLIIGLGGGTMPRLLSQLLPRAHIDVVEIDPAVVRVASRYFGFTAGERMRVIESDARVYVKRALREGRTYELIMLDAFDHEYIPEHLLTREFLQEVKTLLTPGGVLAANTFSSSRLYQHESVTYEAVFERFFNLKRENRVIIAVNGTLPADEALRVNAARLDGALRSYGVSQAQLLPLFSRVRDWDPDARVLTDQYSPANLLNVGH